MHHSRNYDSIDSTNKEAGRLIASGEASHGLLLMASTQTEGRGQYGRTWHTQPGDHLAMSIILLPAQMLPGEIGMLSMKVSLAIIRTLQAISADLKPLVKWPNDIYLEEKKLSGILIENSLTTHKVQHSIIGIGMNVNETSFPPELYNAISLHIASGKTFSIPDIALQIRDQVMDLIEETSQVWKEEYDQFIFGKNSIHRFEENGEILEAEIESVDLDGKLVLRNENKAKSYFSHQLKWIL